MYGQLKVVELFGNFKVQRLPQDRTEVKAHGVHESRNGGHLWVHMRSVAHLE